MGAAKGTLRPDQTAFRKRGTGQPVLIPKKEGKLYDKAPRREISNVERERLLSLNQTNMRSLPL